MSENEDKKDDNTYSLDEAKLKKMHMRGHYNSMLEDFDKLLIKLSYDTLTKEEALKFVTYIKYFKQYGHSEAMRLRCDYLYKKYVEKFNL